MGNSNETILISEAQFFVPYLHLSIIKYSTFQI